MSYYGSKFPENIGPEYVEIAGPESISCPKFRRTVVESLSSTDTTYFNCQGCGAKDSLIIVINPETERLFVKADSNCTTIDSLSPPQKRPSPNSE